jgi:hypothetical protein
MGRAMMIPWRTGGLSKWGNPQGARRRAVAGGVETICAPGGFPSGKHHTLLRPAFSYRTQRCVRLAAPAPRSKQIVDAAAADPEHPAGVDCSRGAMSFSCTVMQDNAGSPSFQL